MINETDKNNYYHIYFIKNILNNIKKLPTIQKYHCFSSVPVLCAISLFPKLNNYFVRHFGCVPSLCTQEKTKFMVPIWIGLHCDGIVRMQVFCRGLGFDFWVDRNV